jgi:hypothetical protein
MITGTIGYTAAWLWFHPELERQCTCTIPQPCAGECMGDWWNCIFYTPRV